MGAGEGKLYVLALPCNEQVDNRKALTDDDADELMGELNVSHTKDNAREASNVHTDDNICSGASDLVAVNDENDSNSMDSGRSINTDDLSGLDFKDNTGELTSESSANSCSVNRVCTSQVTQETPKPAGTTGGLKIRLKIRMRSEECKSNFSTSEPRVFLNEDHDGITSTSLSIADKHTDGERWVAERRSLPTSRVGKSLNQQSASVVTGVKRKRVGSGGKRSDSLHKLLFQPNGVPDGAYLAYCMKGLKVLEGHKQGNGIFCGHCSKVISPSQFEAHAGMAARRKPYQHIFDANGKTLHDLALSLADGLNQISWKNNNDVRLTQIAKSEIDFVDPLSKPKPIVIRLKRTVAKSQIDYVSSCVLCSARDFSTDILLNDRTVIICDQCEKEYHVGCLREAGRCELKDLPEDKWFCCNDCDRISVSLRERVARGSEVIPFSETSKINKRLVEKRSRELADSDVQWCLLNGKGCLPEHQPLLSKAVHLFRESFSPITTLTGKDLITLMVHGKSISGQEFGGMYCVFLTVKSVVVSVGLLRIFGRKVAELPLVATRKRCQGKGYLPALLSRIEKLLRFLKVEKLVLPAAEQAKPMWVNRFGFSDMSMEKLSMYSTEFQLTQFSGTVMLEKQLELQKEESSNLQLEAIT